MAVSRRLPLAASLLLCLPACLKPIADPDLPWHLAAARWILEHRAVPRTDMFSWSRAGAPWVDFEWAAQLLLYGADRAGGAAALWALKALLFLALLACMALLLRRWSVPGHWTAFALPPAALALSPYLNARPELFGVFLCLAQLALLEDARERPAAWKPAALGALQAALYAAWANLHGSFPLGLGLCALYALESGPAGRTAALMGAAGAAGTLVNPYGPRLYEVILEHGRDIGVLRSFIVEWTDIDLLARSSLPHLLLLSYAFGTGLVAVLKGRLPRAHLAVLIAVGLFSTGPFRHSIYIPLVLMPLALKTSLSLELPPAARRLRPAAAAALVLFVLAADRPLARAASTALAPPPEDDARPARAVEFLKREKGVLGPLRLYNSWNCGGYLDRELFPDYRVFIDGRYLFTDMLPALDAAYDSPAAWRAYARANRFDVTLTLLKRPLYRSSRPDASPWRPFDVLGMPAPEWALVYWDDVSMIFVRRAAVPAGWLARREFRYLRPGDLQFVAIKTEAGDYPFEGVAAETRRYESEIGAPAETRRLTAWLANLRRETGRPAAVAVSPPRG